MSPEQELVIKAIQHGNCLKFRYNGYVRIVEPHTLGISNLGNPILRAYQVAGKSNRGPDKGWHLFNLDLAILPQEIKRKSLTPRDGYKPGDKAMVKIIHEIALKEAV